MSRELPTDLSAWTTQDALSAVNAGLPLPREVAVRLLTRLLVLDVQQERGYRRVIRALRSSADADAAPVKALTGRGGERE